MNVLDLFSGIGGFSLGLERAGMRTVAFCEIDPYCRAVLRRHWPSVPRFEDVRSLHAADISTPVDLVCGGFPCQDISLAGKGAGLSGERSGLWHEFRRLIDEIRPAWVVIENVAILRARGLDEILGQLHALGYDAEWHCIPAKAVGAPHERDRLWIVAYPSGERSGEARGLRYDESTQRPSGGGEKLSDTESDRRGQGGAGRFAGEHPRLFNAARDMADADGEQMVGASIAWPKCNPWLPEPDVGRVVDGLPVAVVEQELRALGNTVVPQIPEIIGRAIMQAEGLSA